jgi:hypothetical protein
MRVRIKRPRGASGDGRGSRELVEELTSLSTSRSAMSASRRSRSLETSTALAAFASAAEIVVARVAGRALDQGWTTASRQSRVEEVGDLVSSGVGLELRAGENRRDLRDQLRADNELEALARPRAEHMARRRGTLDDERRYEDACVDDRARHAAASRSRRIA